MAMGGALSGVRVLEFSEMIAAPFAGMMLGDLGADIVKVEPTGGESWRLSGQFAPTESRSFIAINRNKRGLAIDLKTDEGREVIYKLVPDIDVVIVNYRPDTPANLGIDYDTLRAINERIIYVANTAMGSRGPSSHRPGYDLVVQAMTGLMATGGRQDADGVPLPLNPPIADLSTGLTMAFAVCAALYSRERTGRGQKVESTLMATALSFQGTGFLRASIDTPRAGREESEAPARPTRPANAYYRSYVTKDGVLSVAALNPALRRKFADAVGIEDPRQTSPDLPRTGPEAIAVAEKFTAEVMARLQERTTDEWLDVFDAAGVPAGPFRRVVDLVDDPQIIANDLVVELHHPVAEKIKMVGPIVRMSETPTEARFASPTLGQHTDEILRELGYSDDAIAALREKGVVAGGIPAAEAAEAAAE